MSRDDSRPGLYAAVAAGWGVSTRGLPYVDLRGLYVGWWPVVDFAVFSAIFVGAAHATVGRRLEGKGGELVSIGVGSALALGAIGTEWALGLNLASFGPVAAAVVFSVLAIVLVRLFASLGLKTPTAVVAALVLLTLAMSAVSPAFGQAAPWLQGLLQIGVVLGVVLLVVRGIVGTDGVRGGERLLSIAGALDENGQEPKDSPGSWAREEVQALKGQKRSVTGALRPITRQERKAARRVLSELRLARKVLDRSPLSQEDQQAVASALSRIPPKRHELAELIGKIREMNSSLERFDREHLTRTSGPAGAGSVREKSAAYRVSLGEKEKLDLERRLGYLESFVERYDRNAAACAQRAGELLLSGDVAGGRKWLDEAVRFEEEAVKMIERTRVLEKMLLRATRREIRVTKRAA